MPDASSNADQNELGDVPSVASASVDAPEGASFGNDEARRGRLEAVLFLAKEPLNTRKLAQMANLVDGTDARTLSRQLNRIYDENKRAFRIEEIAGGLQLRTRPVFSSWIRRMGHVPKELRLSGPSMETLSVVAYRQPVIRADIEAIRGVACGEILRQLMERDLVRIAGRSSELGRPFLYGTTKQFLQVFGLRSLDEMPRAGDFRDSLVDNCSGQSQAGHDSMVNEDPTDEGVTDVSVTVEQETEFPTAMAINGNQATDPSGLSLERVVPNLGRLELVVNHEVVGEELDDEELDDEELDDEEFEEEELGEDELGEDEEWVYEDDEDDDDVDDDELGEDEEWVYEDDEDDDEDDDDELGEDEEWVYEDDDEDEWEEVEDDDDEDDDDDDELGEDEEWVYEGDDEDDDVDDEDDDVDDDEEWADDDWD